MQYQCVSAARIIPEQFSAVLSAAVDLAETARKEEGNLRFDILLAQNVGNTLIITEIWESKEDFLRHVSNDSCSKFGMIIDPACDGKPHIFECELYF